MNEESIKLPQGVYEAAENGELVLFVGAAVSRLLGCPSWEVLAQKVLEHIRVSKGINYADLQALSEMDLKKRLSIAIGIAEKQGIPLDYRAFLEPVRENPEMKDLYRALYSIGSVFITTNYDEYLDHICGRSVVATSGEPDPSVAESTATGSGRIYYKKEDLTIAKLNELGSVIHLHGSIKDPQTMIITTSDYIEHYQNDFVMKFLADLFRTKVVLFIGYGLNEEEILEYALRKRKSASGAPKEKKHFWLYPLLKRDRISCDHLKEYFLDNFGVDFIEYAIDQSGHDALANVISHLATELKGKGKNPVFYKEVEEALGDIS